jgi:K+-transporting ATPase ATPase C chain
MLREIRPAVTLMLALTLLTGLVYPLAVTGIAQAVFPRQANGSLIERDGKVVGSALIGQNFSAPRYFHGRPSATTDTDPNDATKTIPAPYNAANSGGSNLAPTARALVDRVQEDVGKLTDGKTGGPVPADLVTTSASGLDPDISPAAALLQVRRVAAARHLPEAALRGLVEHSVEDRTLGVLGEKRVNVLALNLVLDGLKMR